MKKTILELLRNTKEYISGQEISNQLGISRTAVWKNIQSLQNEGYRVEAVRNKGYHLLETPNDVTFAEVSHALSTKWIGHELYCYDKIDSTNLQIKRLAEEGKEEGTLAIADCQESGRGRRGRSWASPSGDGLWMSLLLRPKFSIDKASMITLLVAMAVQRGIQNATGLQTQIKWPNDIVYEGRKVCGILTEMTIEESHINYVVVGIGVNVNTESFPDELKEKAISLKMILNRDIKRADLANEIWLAFEQLYPKFLQIQNLSFIKEEYDKNLVNQNQPIYLMEKNGTRQVTQLGLGIDGGLEVRNEAGETEHVYSGEISIRGVYGYTN